MGSLIANNLSSKGKSVIIIDIEESSFDSLTTDFSGFRIPGDATQASVLNQAKVEKSDLMLVLTGDDNVNLAVAQAGKHYYKVTNTIARVFDPDRELIFRKLGIHTICPTRLSVDSLIDMIRDIENEMK